MPVLGDPQRLAGGVLVAELGGDHAEVVLDHRVARQLGGAVLEEGQGALGDAAPVEDPAERWGDRRAARE